MVSDAHSSVYISLTCTTNIASQSEIDTEDIAVIKANWNPEASEVFLHHLNTNDINQFVDRLNLVSSNDVSKEDVETLVSECSSLLFNATDFAGMFKHSTARATITRNSTQRPWFNAECQRLGCSISEVTEDELTKSKISNF